METDGRGCGTLYSFYAAAREDDVEGMRAHWSTVRDDIDPPDGQVLARIDEAVETCNTEAVRKETAELLFGDAEEPTLDDPLARLVSTVLYGFGYLASFVLFLRADTREAVVRRLRWAYRTVGVDIRDTETVDGVARTVFRCPYRNLGANRWGPRRACHDVLDHVDDGYVTWLARHRDLDYRRPRACAASECCYSEVAEQ